MNNLRQFEQDESAKLQRIINDMNQLHAEMGGRDRRPERLALMKCIKILANELEQARHRWANS